MPVILIVDDMPIFREPIEAVLRAEGFQTWQASNGQEAIMAMATAKPDLVLLDLGMPVMDGLACLRHMRSNKRLKSVPVFVLSAEADRARIVEAVKLGIAGYILKSSFSLQKLLERVNAQIAATTPPPSTPSPAGDTASHQAQTSSDQAKASASPLTPLAPTTSISAASPSHTAQAAGLPAPAAKFATNHAINSPSGPSPILSTTPSPTPSANPFNAPSVAPAGIAGLSPAISSINNGALDVKSLKPILTRSDLLERLKACDELKGFSPTVSQVLDLTASPNYSLDIVSKAVRQDQAMALKILKLANSSVYSRGDRVDTVHKAILRIGMDGIRQVVLNIGVVERFNTPAFKEHLSTAQFWEHSIACGIISAELAHALEPRGGGADTAFTSGLLHDLGRVVFAEVLGEQYIHVIETARRLEAPLEQVESRMLLLNHADVMDRLLSAWKFPKQLIDPVMHHHLTVNDARSAAPTRVAEIIRLGLADRLAHAMLLGNSGNETIYPTEDHCKALGISAATIQAIEETAREQTDNTKFALLSSSSSTSWPQRSEQARSLLKNPFRPLYISAEPELDAYRLFCGELSGMSIGQPPNLAVLHVRTLKERALLAERLAAAEGEAGVQDLPLLMLSPTGQLTLDEAVTARRRCHCLCTPIPVSKFIAAVNTLLMPSELQQAA